MWTTLSAGNPLTTQRIPTLGLTALLLVVATGLLSTTAQADAPVVCAQIDDSMARLDCYDQAAPRNRPREKNLSPESNTTNGIAPARVKEAPPAEPDPFWVQAPTPAPGPPLKQEPLQATVELIRHGQSRKLMIRLDNGQIWRQVKPRFMQLKEGDEVVIQAARLGGYILTRARGGSTRVQLLRPQ
ncbi:MAG: hypothetical protein AAF513_11105 [Pseudomonadota bacterium]